MARRTASVRTELEERLRQQQAVADFGRFALSGPPFTDLLNEAARHAAAGLGSPLSKVLEYLPAEDALLVRAGVGWREGVVGTARLGADTASPAGFALKTGRPVLSNHLAAESRFRTPALIAEHGVRRAINAVVRIGHTAFGVLEADSRDPGEFTERDISFVQALANTLGLAIERERERAAREALVAEKELLVQEAHHRVKNGLQMVQAVLSLQARAEADPLARSRFEETGRRVRSIAAVHERLYRAADAGQSGVRDMVDARAYLETLLEDLRASLTLPGLAREVILEADESAWPSSELATMGLILTELVTNAVKHGQGKIAILFRHPPGEVATLTVADEGSGPPEDFDPAASQGLGMRLVIRLLRARGGVLRVVHDSTGALFVAELGAGRTA